MAIIRILQGFLRRLSKTGQAMPGDFGSSLVLPKTAENELTQTIPEHFWFSQSTPREIANKGANTRVWYVVTGGICTPFLARRCRFQ